MNLTRWERFKDARTVHNQHGNETMTEVYAATGIRESKIQALEDEDQERSVGYKSVARLAKHYHVSADYLLGLTDDPHPQRTAIDDLGITPAVAKRFVKLKEYAFLDSDIPGKMNHILNNDEVWKLLRLLIDYATAAKADRICEDILPKHQGRYNDDALCQELLTIAEKYHTTDIDLHDFLRAKAQSIDISGPLSNLGMEDFNLTDLLSAKISRQLTETLFSLERGVKDGID